MYGQPSWRLIVIAVAQRAGGDNVNLALKIAQKYSTTPGMISLQDEWVFLMQQYIDVIIRNTTL